MALFSYACTAKNEESRPSDEVSELTDEVSAPRNELSEPKNEGSEQARKCVRNEARCPKRFVLGSFPVVKGFLGYPKNEESEQGCP